MIDIANILVTVCFITLLLGGIVLTFKTRFVQLRGLPVLFKLFYQSITTKDENPEHKTIKAHRALFAAISGSLGIGNIVAPVFAIGMGGPGALLGFILAAFFGAATAFTEVSFALTYRKKLSDGTIMGGPMQYIKASLGKWTAIIYALSACIMVITWTGKQSNTLANLLTTYGISEYITGAIMAALILLILSRGIKAIGQIAARLVPVMFVLYFTSMVLIIGSHVSSLPHVFKLIFQSAFTPQALLGAGVGIGFMNAMRWGLAGAAFANEAGVGTLTIANSMSSSDNALNQGILSMLSVFTSGLLCTLSGIAILLSGVWQTPNAEFGITMISQMLSNHFSFIGPVILLILVTAFAFGATLGNSFNGGQFLSYVTQNKYVKAYQLVIVAFIFICAIIKVKTLWSISDYFMVPVILPNVVAIVKLAFQTKHLSLDFKK